MRRLLICTMIGALAWYLLRSFDLVAMVNISEFVPSDAKPYADAILLGVYTLLIMLVAPPIQPKVDMKMSYEKMLPLLQSLSKVSWGNLNTADLVKLKSNLHEIEDIQDNFDLEELTVASEQVAEISQSVSKIANGHG